MRISRLLSYIPNLEKPEPNFCHFVQGFIVKCLMQYRKECNDEIFIVRESRTHSSVRGWYREVTVCLACRSWRGYGRKEDETR